VDRSTISTAIRQIRPLLASRGFATPAGVRLHTLADVIAYAAAEGLTVRLDGTEIQVRRPRAHRPGRRAFVSGKKKQNTIKATIASDARGRPLWCGAIRPGRMHDQTAVRTEGIDDLLDAYPDVRFLVDSGYRGLAKHHPGQVIAPPLKPRKDAPAETIAAYETAESPVLTTHPGRTRHLPTEMVAHPATLHRPPRSATRHHPRRHRSGQRPRRRPVNPPPSIPGR
jgi:hypothetical protein